MLSYPYLWDEESLGGGGVEIVTWADGTDEQVKNMILAAQNGEIILSDYWSVGDERDITLAAMEKTDYMYQAHREQTVTIVLYDSNGLYGIEYNLTTYLHNGFKVSFVAGFKNMTSNSNGDADAEFINTTNLTAGVAWEDSSAKRFCNEVVLKALPQWLQDVILSVYVHTGRYNRNNKTKGTLNGSFNKIFYLAEKEVQGVKTYSTQLEYDQLTQLDYFIINASNKIKYYKDGFSLNWWLRSPYYNSPYSYCSVSSTGYADYNSVTSGVCGFAPAFCF